MKTKTSILILAALFFSSLLIIQFGCKKEEDEEPQPDQPLETIVTEDTEVIDSTQINEPIIEDNTYTFDYTGQQPDIQAGDVIVGQTGEGYMRKVTSVSYNNNQMILETNQAALTDVLEQCDIYDSIMVGIGQKSTINGNNIGIQYIEMTKGVSTSNGIIDLSNVVLFSGDVGEAHLEAKITEGYISFEPKIIRKLKIRQGQVKIFRLIARGDLDFEFKVEVTCTGEINYTPYINPIFVVHIGPFFFGPVPALIKLSFTPGITTELNVDGFV